MKGRYGERDIEFLRGCTETVVCEVMGVTNPSQPIKCPNPEHEDSDPSAHFYAKDGLVHCFGCDGTWDVFALVGMVFGITGFREQVEKVAEIVGYRLEEDDGPPKLKPKRKPRPPFDPPREAGGADCYEAIGEAFGKLYSPGGEAGRRWLLSRGIDDYDASNFALGFTTNPKEILPQFNVYEPNALGFVTIPYLNRAMDGADYCMLRTIPKEGAEIRCKEWRPKGVPTPLWNEWALTASFGVVCVTEGLVDAIALNKLWRQPVVALGGTGNAKRLAQVLYAAKPEERPGVLLVCMDADDAGRKAAARISADLDKIGVRYKCLDEYPTGAKDPDEWLMNLRGDEWEYEQRDASIIGLGVLYRTKWSGDGS